MIPHRIPRPRQPLRPSMRFGSTAPLDGASALPADVVRALRLVAAEMRDMPRDCATDRRELVHWLARLARRLDAVAASQARVAATILPSTPPLMKSPLAAPASASTPLPAPVDHPALMSPSPPRPSRRGPPWRAVPIAASARRRAEAAGQLDLFR